MTAMIARRPLPTFVGGEELLDQLIAASAPPGRACIPISNIRDLQPYFPANAENSGKPTRQPKRGGSGAASPPKNRPTKEKKSRANSPPNNARPKATTGQKGSSPRAAASPVPSLPGAPQFGQWAGPGYVVSPKPDALPIPPLSLLQKA